MLARKWAYLLSSAVFVPLSGDELDAELGEQLGVLCASVHAKSFVAAPIEALGERLVSLGNVGEQGLRCTLEVLGKGLLALSEFQPVDRFAERITVVLGTLACGFVSANQRAVLDQQESMQRSLLKAIQDAQWSLRASEARFDEVATSSASGIMIIGLDGRLVRANAAMAEILGYSPAQLTGVGLYDLVHPDSVRSLRAGMRSLLDGTRERVRQSQRLLRKDGDVARISLAASLLRGLDGRTSQVVAVVEDGTELMLLRHELHRQSLHDPLTGLPNRQFFGTRVESALRRADPAHGITLFHLDLDGFAMVCGGLGRSAGEQLLVHVGQRLNAVMAGENAMVARFDGDEFGILLENSATTSDVAAIVSRINTELTKPAFVDGHGLALSASIGVVHRPSRDLDPAEPLRAADLALRRAKAGRRGQWELYHPDQDAADRGSHALAVTMPGAWEQGQFGVRYQPVAHLADGRTAAVTATLRWDRPGQTPLHHDRCAELAEQTGFILPLGEWLLRVACGQAYWWHKGNAVDLPLTLGLTAHQSTDADLVSRVVRVLEETGLPPDRLTLGMPIAAVGIAEALDNLTVLADMGLGMTLDDFGLSPDDLSAVESLPVTGVRVARRLTDRLSGVGSTVVSTLLGAVHQAGAAVTVVGVRDPEQAQWWTEAGADTAIGGLYGPAGPPGDIVAGFRA
ncbi:putative bifunctional diguanylate cyclase/phosphodiesterase [Actinokineospora xionganensis]|uniref:putative bifunctional diguanylate cyclase/phosphodiesterase n=1 Tax=Actinokineospora xionganensis TaxID=2684470 RepID=UPI0028A8E1F3|nr:EAL domain-containing protein [Actinokineospora xionganensis]